MGKSGFVGPGIMLYFCSMKKLFCFLLVLLSSAALAQTHEIDSLKQRIRNANKDSVYVKDLNELAWLFLDYSSDSSQSYVSRAQRLAQELNFSEGLIDAKNTQGILYRYAGETEKALQLYQEIISLRTQQGRNDKLTGAYANLGSVYFEQGDNAGALKYYLKAYQFATDLNQVQNQMILLNNLGAAYKSSGLNELAIEAFKKGIELNKSFRDEFQEAQFYSNIATVYDQQELYKESVHYAKQAYTIFKKNKNIRQLSTVVNNLSLASRHLNDYRSTEAYLREMKVIADELKENDYYVLYHQSRANYYHDLARFKEALQEADKAILMCDSAADRAAYGTSLLIKGSALINSKHYEKGMQYYRRGITIVKDVDDKHHLAKAYFGMSEAFRGMGDYRAALDYYRRADEMLDSLNTDAFNTKMATLNSLNELDKKERELQLSIKENESMEAKNKLQAQFLIATLTVGLLVLVLLVFSIRAYRVKKKDNELLSQQKLEIEAKNNILHTQKLEIEGQKLLVEQKQKEILDSIHYARRIQRALLAKPELINRHLSDNFILYKPKDIVSGDFYWAAERDGRFYLAVCDSTGHGVPGAFMSLLNISFLNEAINEKGIVEPNQVLDHVRKKLIENVSHDGSKDGMDGVLICFDPQQRSLTYASAYNRPLLISEGKLVEYPADKMPIGMSENTQPYTLHNVNFEQGDVLYLYSDGYADQFGGPGGKKFKYKALQSELLKISALPLSEQALRMDQTFENWKGQLEQVDDVILIGIRL